MMDIFKKFFALFLTSAVMFLYAFLWIIAGICFALRELWQWGKGAALYDLNAIDQAQSEHCHQDYYAIVAGFGSEKAASLYADAVGQQLTEEEKKWFRKNFLKHGVTLQSRE